ncbi:MAG: Rrf2 family transcriptional regulator [bacterium]|nr:Rrf2 family transcriptional regulator [bacterium]
MLVSTRGRYATRMLLDIAIHQGDGYVSMKEVAERQRISKKYMETFTAQLAAAGILGIRRGKNGGYRLLMEPSMVTLYDIVHAAEGPVHAVACLECEPNRCARAGFCMTLPAWAGLEKVVWDYMRSVTLQQLIDQAAAQPENIGDYPCGV